MPAADTVWPIPLTELVGQLSGAGLEVRWIRECSRSHRLVADALIDAFLAERSAIEAELGDGTLDDLLAAHRLWRDWMATGRVRKFAIVAVKTDGHRAEGERRGAGSVQEGETFPRLERVMNIRLLAAAAVLVSAAVHLYLWFDGMREADVVGPAFMLNAVGGAVIAVLLVFWRHWIPPFLALGFGLSTLTAFVTRRDRGALRGRGVVDGVGGVDGRRRRGGCDRDGWPAPPRRTTPFAHAAQCAGPLVRRWCAPPLTRCPRGSRTSRP